MARLAATGHTELGFDTVMPCFSIIQESSALGCKIQWKQKDNWPTVKMPSRSGAPGRHPYSIEAVLEHRDTQCLVEAIKILRRELGDEVAVIGRPWGRGRSPTTR